MFQGLPRHCTTLAAAEGRKSARGSRRGYVLSRPGKRTGGRWEARCTKAVSQALTIFAAMTFAAPRLARAHEATAKGLASWYGEEHRGKLMANGKRFNPDKFTAASWFYPLGTKVRVTLTEASSPRRSVVVTITDRGPAKEYVRAGRIIDLSRAPFKRLARPCLGLVDVAVRPVR